MLDIKFIRENPDLVKKGLEAKGYKSILVDELLKLDEKRRKIIAIVDEKRSKKNVSSRNFSEEGILVARDILTKEKQERKQAEKEAEEIQNAFDKLLQQIPNLPSSGVPFGKDESENKEIKKVGEIVNFDFKPKDHLELGIALDLLDFERGAKVAGSGFYYLKNEAVNLELALVSYGIDFLTKKGFIPYITPDLAKSKYYEGTGYLPKGPEAQTYTIENSDLGLIATAEITLTALHADEILPDSDLPRKYAGYSHCYRQEGGSYGKYSKGLYRVHQFTKVEMYAYTRPEQSDQVHQELLGYEEEFWQSLKIPYRVIEMCTGDLGAQAAKKYDLEAWMPGRDDWGEITSTSNTKDFQARGLNIKYKKGNVANYVHTLNGTLVATSRGPIAIMENYQQKDGSIEIPKVLQKYTGFTKIPR